jgi:hypothetical protein
MDIFACSGPGAGETIARNIAIGYTHAAIDGGLLALSLGLWWFVSRQRVFPAICAALVLLHPAWTVSAIGGDCGYLKRDLSWVFTGIAVLSLVGQAAWAVRVRWRGGQRG